MSVVQRPEGPLKPDTEPREGSKVLWTDFARELVPNLVDHPDKKLYVMSPCCGLDTPYLAFRAAGIGVESFAYDTEEKLRPAVIEAHGGAQGVVIDKEKGDICKLFLSSLPACEFVCAGPPCPPFSRSGVKGVWCDKRTDPLAQTMLTIKQQALRDDSRLLGFVLENVKGMVDRRLMEDGTRKSPLDEIK
eukprot:6016732-Pyramimonas_sp.AAC.1